MTTSYGMFVNKNGTWKSFSNVRINKNGTWSS